MNVWTRLVVVASTMVVVVPAATAVHADPPDWVGGNAAIERLAGRLPAVAARNGLTPAQLRSDLLTDATLHVDGQDHLLYVDPAQAAPGPDTTWLDDGSAVRATFTEHSKPGSSRVIYLDFDGENIAGTAWNKSTGRKSCYTDAYNADGGAGFSNTELESIHDIWRRVAEDYAPFDVDVTLQVPAADAITLSGATDTVYGTRALITNSTTKCFNGKTLYSSVCSSGCGGVAYVGVFDQYGSGTSAHSYYQPALVFQNGVGPGPKNVAEAVSHEVGHNLGLSHDGTNAVGYYAGHGAWAPIMGVGYYRAVTHWSKGEYAGANNKQDDFVVMGQNGAAARIDEPTGTLAVGDSVSGVITSATDVDGFVLTVAAAQTVTIDAMPAAVSPDLDILLTVTQADGTTTIVDNPPTAATSGDSASGLGARIVVGLTAGTYTVTIDGVGFADPASSGYSDYASVGGYTVSVTAG